MLIINSTKCLPLETPPPTIIDTHKTTLLVNFYNPLGEINKHCAGRQFSTFNPPQCQAAFRQAVKKVIF